MKRFLALLAMLAAVPLCWGTSRAQAPVDVVVLPFEVYAAEELQYLGTQVPEMLGRQLQDAGARLATPARPVDAADPPRDLPRDQDR